MSPQLSLGNIILPVPLKLICFPFQSMPLPYKGSHEFLLIFHSFLHLYLPKQYMVGSYLL